MIGKKFFTVPLLSQLRNIKTIRHISMVPFNVQSLGISILEQKDISYLDSILLGRDGLPKVVSYNDIKNVPNTDISLWCVNNAVYQIATFELIEFLRNEIGNHSAIEICSGYGHVGRSLGIPITDSYMQTRPEIEVHYASLNQKTIHPPEDVLKMEATVAVDHFNPDIVIGCFATHKWQPGDKNGSDFGVNEEYILEKVKKFIHIGNEKTHESKRILKIPHKSIKFPWLVSRAIDQSKNVIWIWEMQPC